MNRAERRQAAKRKTPQPVSFLDALLDQHVPGGCADCDAYTYTQLVDGIYRMAVYHDPTCPYLTHKESR